MGNLVCPEVRGEGIRGNGRREKGNVGELRGGGEE